MMNTKTKISLIAAAAIGAAAGSIPIYLVAFIGVAMSSSHPHLGIGWACILWSLPLICATSCYFLLRISPPVSLWRKIIGFPLLACSLVQMGRTLLILMEG
jgi:hypothetical protein